MNQYFSPWQWTSRQNPKIATDFWAASVTIWMAAGFKSSENWLTLPFEWTSMHFSTQLFIVKALYVFSGLMGGTLSRVTALLGSGRSNRQVIWNIIFPETILLDIVRTLTDRWFEIWYFLKKILSDIVRTLISFSGHVLCGRRGDSSLHSYILFYITVLMKLFVIDVVIFEDKSSFSDLCSTSFTLVGICVADDR